MTDTIVPYRVSTNITLSNRLLQLDDQFERAAAENLDAALAGSDGGYTTLERRAIIKFEKLKLIGNLGLTEILLRGNVLDEIEREGLWSILPGNHQTLEAAARAQGIATSTLSLIKDLCRLIFPYVTDTLGWDLAETWEAIGASSFREIVPVLKVLITGEESGSAQVNATAEHLLENIRASDQALGTTRPEAEERQMAVQEVLELGQLPVREVRTQLRPDRTPSVHAYIVQRGDRRYLVSTLTEDQWTMMQRKMSGYLDATPSNPRDLRSLIEQLAQEG